ncbi:MAG: hypothetical protein WC081_03100 [Candidatus Ratteibacteria bacterium]|jgi:hypothetical protein
MKKIIAAFGILVILALTGASLQASEEDGATITKIELTAKTTVNTFGEVMVCAETTQGKNGLDLSSLIVTAKGKRMSVPKETLAQISRPRIMTTTVSSEVGYPSHNLGPFLYVCFLGDDGSMPCRFRLVFGANGFRELKREDYSMPNKLLLGDLQKSALEMYITYVKAVDAGKEKSVTEIPPRYWTDPIKVINPIKVYTHRANVVLVQKVTNGVESGKYIYIPFSSYLPQNGDDGFTFTLKALSNDRVYDYQKSQK